MFLDVEIWSIDVAMRTQSLHGTATRPKVCWWDPWEVWCWRPNLNYFDISWFPLSSWIIMDHQKKSGSPSWKTHGFLHVTAIFKCHDFDLTVQCIPGSQKCVHNAAGPISSTIPSRVLGTTTPSAPMSIPGSGNRSAAALYTPPNWNLRAERLGFSVGCHTNMAWWLSEIVWACDLSS